MGGLERNRSVQPASSKGLNAWSSSIREKSRTFLVTGTLSCSRAVAAITASGSEMLQERLSAIARSATGAVRRCCRAHSMSARATSYPASVWPRHPRNSMRVMTDTENQVVMMRSTAARASGGRSPASTWIRIFVSTRYDLMPGPTRPGGLQPPRPGPGCGRGRCRRSRRTGTDASVRAARRSAPTGRWGR